MTYRERVVRGKVTSEHVVQLFDDCGSLAETLSSYIEEGLTQGEIVLLVVRPQSLRLTAECLARRGGALGPALASGRIVVRDAEETLGLFMRNDAPDPALFHETVGALVRHIGARSTAGLRIFGEMVDVLATEGDFRSAHELEALWNDLAAQVSFTLLCGYSAGNFGDPRSLDSLRLICRAHSHVRAEPRDLLGSYLLKRAQGRQAANSELAS